MRKGTRYTDEFKQEAVNQVVANGYSVSDVSKRLGISDKSLYGWIKRFSLPQKNAKRMTLLKQKSHV